MTTLTQASLTLQTARSLRPASHPTSRSRTGASLPGTQASPRTGLTPAGHRELIAPTSYGPPFPHDAGAVPAHASTRGAASRAPPGLLPPDSGSHGVSVAAYPREHERRSSTRGRRESRKSPAAQLASSSAGWRRDRRPAVARFHETGARASSECRMDADTRNFWEQVCRPPAARTRFARPAGKSGRSAPRAEPVVAVVARRGEVGSRTQDTRNHRSAVILVGGISVAPAVPEHQ